MSNRKRPCAEVSLISDYFFTAGFFITLFAQLPQTLADPMKRRLHFGHSLTALRFWLQLVHPIILLLLIKNLEQSDRAFLCLDP